MTGRFEVVIIEGTHQGSADEENGPDRSDKDTRAVKGLNRCLDEVVAHILAETALITSGFVAELAGVTSLFHETQSNLINQAQYHMPHGFHY